MENISFKNYVVIFLGTLLGLFLLTLLSYTGQISKEVNMQLIISDDYEKLNPGNELKASLIIYNVEKIESFSVIYSIRRIGSTELTTEEELISVEHELIHPISFILPKNTDPGIYELKAKIRESDNSASAIFRVARNTKETLSTIMDFFIYLLILSSIITLAILTKKNWEWLKSFRINMKQAFFEMKWKARRRNYFLKYLYSIIIIIIFIIAILWLIK